MMGEYTPKPWHHVGALIRAPDGNRTIATVWGEGLSGSQQEADIHLITAAPELLAACESAQFELSGLVNQFGLGFTRPSEHPVIQRLEAAITKAKGE